MWYKQHICTFSTISKPNSTVQFKLYCIQYPGSLGKHGCGNISARLYYVASCTQAYHFSLHLQVFKLFYCDLCLSSAPVQMCRITFAMLYQVSYRACLLYQMEHNIWSWSCKRYVLVYKSCSMVKAFWGHTIICCKELHKNKYSLINN